MTEDLLGSKPGQVLEHVTQHAVATDENDARQQLHRPKKDTDGLLSQEWELTKITKLNKYWG